MSMLTIGILKV
jgi:hypothetical protein